MKTYPIKFNCVDDIENFTRVMSECEPHADLKCGSILVDAKSIIGVFTIGVNKTLELILHGGIDEQFERKLAAFA